MEVKTSLPPLEAIVPDDAVRMAEAVLTKWGATGAIRAFYAALQRWGATAPAAANSGCLRKLATWHESAVWFP